MQLEVEQASAPRAEPGLKIPSASSAQVARKKQHARSRVSNGRDILPGVDGRSVVARRYRDVSVAIFQDQGGESNCSESRKQLVRRFAAASVMAEMLEAELAQGKAIDVTEHALLVSTAVRVAMRIGLDRRSRNITPTLSDYLRADEAVDVADEEALP